MTAVGATWMWASGEKKLVNLTAILQPNGTELFICKGDGQKTIFGRRARGGATFSSAFNN